MGIQIKERSCKGVGKAVGHGCGSMQLKRTYGLGYECQCFQNWLLHTEEGKEKIERSRIQSKKKIEKETRKEATKKKKSMTDYKPLLQEKINYIVRLIDIGLPCLARGTHADQIHAGHIYSRGAHTQIRYNLHNIHRQSAGSNHYQNEDGLLRESLKNEYGESYADYVSGLRATKALHYSNDDYAIFYKKACKIALRLRNEGKMYIHPEDRIKKRTEINKELGIY